MYIFRFGMASIKYGLELATEIRASVFISNSCKNATVYFVIYSEITAPVEKTRLVFPIQTY